MMLLTYRVDCEPWQVPGVKEDIAMILERRGDVRLVEAREVKTDAPEQLRLAGMETSSSPPCCWTGRGKLYRAGSGGEG